MIFPKHHPEDGAKPALTGSRSKRRKKGHDMTSKLLALAAAAALSLAAIDGAQAQTYGNLADEVKGELDSQGYDTDGFEHLSLAQITMIKQMMEDPGNKAMIQGILRGSCGNVVLGN